MTETRRKSRWPRRLLVLLVLVLAGFFYARQFHPELEDVPGQRAQLAQRAPVERPLRIDAAGVLADVRALSAPAMQGRAIGTPGGALARAYIEQRFRDIG